MKEGPRYWTTIQKLKASVGVGVSKVFVQMANPIFTLIQSLVMSCVLTSKANNSYSVGCFGIYYNYPILLCFGANNSSESRVNLF